MTDAPRISDDEIMDFICDERDVSVRYALTKFLCARVPDAMRGYAGAFENGQIAGFNACRDAVLGGPPVK